MQFQQSPTPSNFSLEPCVEHPLSVDGISVVRVVSHGAPIRNLNQLEQIFDRTEASTVVLFPREALGGDFMRAISLEAEDSRASSSRSATQRWNGTGGRAASNAIPHIHDHFNCHAAPDPSEISTTFFTRQSILDAIDVVRYDRQISRDIRLQLSKCLYAGSKDDIFYSLHTLSELFPEYQVLSCMQAIQKHATQSGGAFEVDLGAKQIGIVGIPAFALHARSLSSDLIRSTGSAWRYFGSAVEKKSTEAL